jgi:hypothetical protein
MTEAADDDLPGPHSGPRMRLPRDQKLAALARYDELVIRGKGHRAAVIAISHEFQVSRHTARCWARIASLAMRQRIEGRRDNFMAQQVARLEKVMELALDHEEVSNVVTECNGDPPVLRETRVKRPDLRVYLAAVTEMNRLLGLHPATVEQQYAEAGMALVREVFEAIRPELTDPEMGRRLRTRLHDALARHRRRPAAQQVVDVVATPVEPAQP